MEELEDTKRVIRIRTPKDRQRNGQAKKDKGGLQSTEIEQHEAH